MWVRGLKQRLYIISCSVSGVAPYVGAWIETNGSKITVVIPNQSHPMWVRGLKQTYGREYIEGTQSHPMWVRGLKRVWVSVASMTCSRTLCGCVD